MLCLLTVLLAAPPGETASLSKHLEVPVTAIHKVHAIQVDRRQFGHLVRYRQDTDSYGALVWWNGRQIRFGRVDRFDVRQIFDLQRAGRVHLARGASQNLRARDLRQPVWPIVTREVEATAPRPRRRGPKRRGSGTASEETLHLMDLTSFRRMGRLPLSRRSGDGFGGYDVSGWTAQPDPDGALLLASRQDHLPAHRARCRQPPPVPLRYRLRDGSFRPVDRIPSVRCGKAPTLPSPKKQIPGKKSVPREL
jgi:hypothetical protein